jgi:hypothetical protein
MTRKPFSPLTRAMGLDYDIIAKCVTCCVQRSAYDTGSPVQLTDLARFCRVGEAKIAITMKLAVDQGYMRRASRLPQDSWVPTEKGLETFPPDRAHVMPDAETITTESGNTVRGVSGSEARTWEDPAALPPGAQRKELGHG